MFFKTYDYITGNVIDSSAREFNFGDVIQGQHSQPVLFRGFLDTETTISDFSLYLTDNGGWDAEFGYYKDSSFIPAIEAGSTKLSNHLTKVADATQGSPGGITIDWTDGTSNYIWLDIDIGSTQTGSTEAEYRFIFNYT